MKNKQLNLIIKENIDSYIGNIIAENQQQEGDPVFDAIKGGYGRFKDWRRIHSDDAVIDGDEVHFKNKDDEDAHRKTYQKADPNKSFLRNIWDGMKLGKDVGRLVGDKETLLGKDGSFLDKRDEPYYQRDRDRNLEVMRASDAYKNRVLNKRKPTQRHQMEKDAEKYGYVNDTSSQEQPNNFEYTYTNGNNTANQVNNNGNIAIQNNIDYEYNSDLSQGTNVTNDNNVSQTNFDISQNNDGYLYQHQEQPKKEKLKPLTFNKGDKFSYTTKVDNDSSIKVNKVDPKGKQLVVTNTYPISARKLTTFLNKKGALDNAINGIVREEILKKLCI